LQAKIESEKPLLPISSSKSATVALEEPQEQPAMFQIPPGMMAPDSTIDGLITAVFGDIRANYNQPGYLSGRAILSPKNVDVDALNNKVLEMIPGEVGSFHSESQRCTKQTSMI
jgi:hypothetical protein